MLSFLRNGEPVMLSLLRGGGTIGKMDIHAFKHFLPHPPLLLLISSAKLEIITSDMPLVML